MPSSVLPRISNNPRLRWVAAALAAGGAVALRALLQPALGDDLPFVIAAPVSLFCALVWGAGPGALAASICLVGTLLPGVAPDVLNRDNGFKAVGFALLMVLACALIGRGDGNRRGVETAASSEHTPLVRWLNAALLGAAFIPLTAFFVVGWWTYERESEAAQATAERRAEIVHEHARRTFDVAQRLAMETSALTAGDDQRIRSQEADARQRLSDMLLGFPAVVNVNVWNEQAVPLVRSDRAINPEVTVADRDYFRRQATADQGFDVSEVLTGRQTGRELFNLTHRRPSEDGSFRGIVAVSLNPEYFRDYYRAIVAQNTDVEAVVLVRTDGAILARWPLAPSGTTRLPVDAPSLLAIQRGETSGVVSGRVSPSGEQRTGAFRRLEGLPVYVVVGFSRNAQMAGWVRTMGIIGVMALPIALMLVAVTAIARRRVISEQRAQRDLHEQTRLRDATEKRALEAHRRDTLAALTAGVAHDFNNLLAIVSNSLHVQNLRHPELAGEPQNAAMQRAIKSGTRLTRQLLSFTRRQTVRPEVIDLHAWLPGMEELLRTTLGSRIDLRISVEPLLPPVLVDAAELELALVNLAVNAKHAQPQGGAFGLATALVTTDGHRYVEITARDKGEGIPAEILSRVTEPFFTTKAPGAGSGLGLSQVRGVVEAAGGQLHIDSEVGRGTCVRLALPVFEVDPVEGGIPDMPPVAPLDRFEGHVLVAEDNDDVAAVTLALIVSLGLRVTRASNAAEALKVLQTPGVGNEIGFLLTDVVMPGAMDGVELALKLRVERPTLPVTVLTGFAENLQVAADARLDVLQKPLALEELMARLRAAFPKANRQDLQHPER